MKVNMEQNITQNGARNNVKVLQVPLSDANQVLNELRKYDIIHPEYNFSRNEEYLFIPVQKNVILPKEIEERYSLIFSVNLDVPLTSKIKRFKPNLKEALKFVLPKEVHDLIPRAFDIIGNIAIIELNRNNQEKIRPYTKIIGEKIREINPHIQTVLEKKGDINGIFRTRALNCIAGKDTKITEYRENLCRFKVDLEGAFFTPRLAYERARIGSLNTKFSSLGYIWDMFCGIGPFFIQIAKKFPNSKIIATDINQNAITLAKENISLNNLSNKIICFQKNVMEMPLHYKSLSFGNAVSRIIMNLPEKNIDFLHILPPFLHPQGALLHIYQFNEKPDPEKEALLIIKEKISALPIVIKKFVNSRVVKPFSPALDTTVLDLIIKRKD